MFGIVNIEHIHADLMVYEKDVSKVNEGELLNSIVESSGFSVKARIYSVGKTFEKILKQYTYMQDRKQTGKYVPGMYLTGKIATFENQVPALQEAVIMKMGRPILSLQKDYEGEQRVGIKSTPGRDGQEDDGWVQLKL